MFSVVTTVTWMPNVGDMWWMWSGPDHQDGRWEHNGGRMTSILLLCWAHRDMFCPMRWIDQLRRKWLPYSALSFSYSSENWLCLLICDCRTARGLCTSPNFVLSFITFYSLYSNKWSARRSHYSPVYFSQFLFLSICVRWSGLRQCLACIERPIICRELLKSYVTFSNENARRQESRYTCAM